MQQSHIKVLTFDLDDTLWECMPVIESAELKLRDWLEIHYPKITRQYSIEAFTNYRNNISAQHPQFAHDFSFIRQTLLLNIAIDAGYSPSEAEKIREQGFEVFITERSNVTLYDDVIPTFEILAQHFNLGALTNGNVDLTKTNIEHYFDFSLNAITAGYPKPDPRFFEHACNLADVDASKIIHIGDDPVHDVHGAVQAGIETVWLNRNNADWHDLTNNSLSNLSKPNNIIQSLSELPALLLNI